MSWLFVFIVIYRSFCQVFRMYQTYWVELVICVYRHLPTFLSSISYVPDLLWVELTICVYRHLPTFMSSFSYVPDLLGWVGYLCLSSFTNPFVKFFVCTRLTGLSWLFVFIVIYQPFCQVFRMYQTYCVELAICVYRHLPIFLSSFSYVPDLLGWVDYLCLSSFTDLFVKFFVCTRLTGLSWLFVFIVIYRPFCQVFRMYQTYCVELTICVYRHLPIFLSSFSYVPDLLGWVGYLCLSSFTDLFVKYFVCTRLTVLSWLFVFIVIYRPFCQVFRMYQTYWIELTNCVYRHLPTFLSSFSYVPDLLRWVGYLCLSSFTKLFVKFFVCTRLTVLSWLFVFIVIYQPFCQVFRMYQTYWVELAICVYRHLPTFLSSFSYVQDLLGWVDYLCLSSFTHLFVKFFVCTRLTGLSWLFVFIVIYQPFCQVFRMYQTYSVELTICVYRHLPNFLSSFSYVPDLLGWGGYLCLSLFTHLFVKFFVCTRLTALSWLFVFIVIYRPFCQVFRMYQTYWVELAICVYRHLPTFLSSFSYVPDLLGWVGYLCLSSFTNLLVKFFVCTRLTGLSWLFVFIVIYQPFCQVFRMYQTYCVELTICVYRHLPTFMSSFSYVPDLLRWVDYLCLSSFTDLFVKFFVCTRLTVLSWLFVFIVIYRPFCQVFSMYQTYCFELAICVYRHLPIFLSSFSYVPDLLGWVGYLCLSSFTDLFVKFFVYTRLTVLSWLFVFIVIYQPFCQVFRMYQTYCVELTICVYRHLPTFMSSFSYVPDLLRWVDYLCLSSFTDLFVKFFVCTRLTVLSWLFVFIVIYRPFCQVFRMYQTYCFELAICVYRHLPIFLSSFSYVPDLLGWVGYLCLSSFTDLFVKFFVYTRLTVLSWLFVFIVIYQPFSQVFRMYMYQTYWVELTICVYRHLPIFLSSFTYVPDLLGWVGYLCLSSFTDLFQFFRIYQTYCVELAICVYRHLPTFLSSFSYVPDLLGWVGYLCLSSFTNLFVKFFVCTRITGLSWLFVFIVIYQPFCQVFRMYQTYWVELAICVYRHLPTLLSSFSYVPDLLGWVDYLCLSLFTNLFVKFFVCTRLTVLSWLFVFIVIYRSFCQVFRMYQTYWVELTICVYRHLPTFLSSFSYVPDLLGWVGYLCLSSFTDLFVKFFVCTRLTALSWLFVFIVIYRSFCQVFRMYQTYWVELVICVYRHLPTFLSSISYVPDLLCWVDYLCLSSFTDLFVKFFVCTRLTGFSWLIVFIVIYRPFCQVFRMYQTNCVELAICVYRHLPTFLSSFSYVPDLLCWVDYLCLSSFTDLFVKFFVCTRLTGLSWLFVFIVIYQPFCQVFRMYKTYWVELTICVYRHLPTFLSSFSYVPDLLCWVGYLCLSSFTNLFVKFFVCTRLTLLSWLFVFIVIYQPFCQVFRMYQTYWVELVICVYRHLPTFLSSFSYVPDLLGWVGYLCLSSFTDLFVKLFFVCTRTYWVELTICVYRHLPTFLSSFSYVPDLLGWVGYLCLSSFTNLSVKFFVCTRLTGLSWLFVFIVIYRPFCQVFRMYQTYWVELTICVYRHLPTFLSSFSYVPDLLGWVGYLCLSSFTDIFVKFFVCTRLTGLSWLFVFIVIYQPFCQVFRMYQNYWVELTICVYRHLPTFMSSFSYVPDLLGWVGYLCLSSFTNPFVKFFVCTRLTGLSWLFVFIVIYQPFCQVFRMYQTYCVELAICVYRHLPIFLSSFSYVPDLLGWVDYLCLSSFTDLFVKFFVCTRLTGLSWLFVFIVIYRPFCQVFRMYQTYCVELTICVYRHLPIFLSSFSYVPDLLGWVGYLCLSSFTDLFVKYFVCTRLTVLSWLFVFIVIYRPFCQVFRMYQTYWIELTNCVYRHLPTFLSSFSYVPDLLRWVGYLCLSSFTKLFVKFFVCTRLTVLSWLFVFIVIYQPFCQVFRMYQTYWVELAICVYRHLPTFLSRFSYVQDLLGWVDYLCLSSFTHLFVKFFVCTRLTVLSWLFVFIVIYQPFCQVFRMYQTYCVELTICVYRHLPNFLSSFSYVPDLLGWGGYLCLSLFTHLFVKFFVCTRLTALSWLFVFIVIYRPFCQVFRMYQTYWVELAICVYRHLPTFLSSFTYVPDLLGWVGYLCLSSFTNLFVKFFVCTRLTGLSWLFVFIVIYRPFCQVFRMYQTYCVELTICVYRHLPTFMSSFSYVPDLLRWVDYLCLSSFTDLFVKFFVCTRLTVLSWLFVFIVIYRPFCQVFRMYQTYCFELAICVYRHLPIFLSSFSYVPDLLGWVGYLCLSSFTDLFVKFFVYTRLTVLSWLFVFIVIYQPFSQVFRMYMYQTYCVELTICVYRHLPIFLSSFTYVPDLLCWVGYLCLSSFTDLFQFFRMYQTYCVELAICVYRHLPTFLSSFSYVPDLLCWVDYLCLSSFTNLFVKFFVCTRLTGLSWLFVFIVIYQPFCQVFRMYQTYWVELTICVYRHLPTFLSSFSYVPDFLCWVGYLCLSSFTNLFVKFFVCTRLTPLSWLFMFIVIYQPFCQVFRMYQTYWVEVAICVYRHLPIFLSSFSYVPDLRCWVGYSCLSSFTDLFVKFFVCTRLTGLSWLFVFIVIYQPFCQVFRMYQTYWVELVICVYRHLPTFLSSFSYVPDLLGWVGYLCLSSFTDLFVKFFVCTRLTALSWLFVFIVIYRPLCQVFRMYQTYWVELTICVYRHLPIFLSSFSYVPDLLCWVDYLCLSSFTDLFVKFFVCTRLTALSWLFVFIVIYRSFCQVFRMYQTYWVELVICVYRHLPTFLSSFSYIPDLLCWVDYLCLSSFTNLFLKFFVCTCTRLTALSWLFVFIVIYLSFCQVFRMYQTYWVELAICVYRHLPTFFSFFVCTRLTGLSWLFVFIVIYRPFCQVFRMYQTYWVELAICVYCHLPIFLSSFSYVPDLLRWVDYLCLSSFTKLFVKFFVCTRLTGLRWLFVFIVIYRSFCQVFRMYQTYWVELAICVYRHLPTFLSSFSYVPDLLGWVGYLCLSSFTNLFVKFFVCTRITGLSWLFVFIVIYQTFCQVFRMYMYQTYCVELAICVYRHLPIFLSSFSYVPDLLGWVDYLCLSSFTDLFVKFFVCTRLTGLSWLFVFIVIYLSFCQVFRMYQTYWVELTICVYRHLPIFLSSFSYVPDLLGWVGYLCLSSFTDLFVKYFVCTRLTVLSWLFVFIVIYRPFCQVFRMYQTYWIELTICVYRHLPTFLSSFSYVPDLLCWVDYLCLSSFTNLFVKFFVCTRLTGLSWLFVFIVIYQPFCQVFRMYQTYCVQLTICVYRHLPTFLSSFSYVPDLLCWVGYLCLSSFTNLFVKFFVCTRLTPLSWLFVFIVIYRSFCQVFRMYQTYWVELAICVYRLLPTFLSSFSYVPDLLRWVGYLCLSSYTDLFVKFFVCTRLTGLSWLFVFIVIYQPFCQVFRMYQTYCVELVICVYRHLPTFLSSISYVPDLLCWVDYLCLSSFTNLFLKFFVCTCTRLTGLSWLFVFIVIYRSFCQVFRMYQTYWVELAICVYRHLPTFLSSFSYVPDLLRWVGYLCLSSYTDLFVKFFVCTRLTGLSWLFVFIVIYRPFCQVFRMYQTYWVELAICVYRHLPTFLSSFSYVPDLLRWVDYLCLSSFTNLFLKFFVCTCTRLTQIVNSTQ